MLLPVLFPMAEEGVALQPTAEATLRSRPEDASRQLQAKAGFCIIIVLPDAQRHGGEEGSPIRQGEGSDSFQDCPAATG